MKVLENGNYEWEVGDYVTGKSGNRTIHLDEKLILGRVVQIDEYIRVEVIYHVNESYIGCTDGVRPDRNALLPAQQSVIDQFVKHLEPVSPQLTFDAIL